MQPVRRFFRDLWFLALVVLLPFSGLWLVWWFAQETGVPSYAVVLQTVETRRLVTTETGAVTGFEYAFVLGFGSEGVDLIVDEPTFRAHPAGSHVLVMTRRRGGITRIIEEKRHD
jgi:hypothetical protein